MEVKRYWDYTARERAELREEDIEKLVSYELMEKGVLRVETPALLPEREELVAGIPKVTMFEIESENARYRSRGEFGGILFKSVEDAQAFLQLNPSMKEYDYEIGSEYNYAKPCAAPTVRSVEVYETTALMNAASQLKAWKSAREANEKARRDYLGALKKVEEATGDLWTDYRQQVTRLRTAKGHKKTLEEYTRMTGGDVQLAGDFLVKAIGAEAVRSMFEYLGEEPSFEVGPKGETPTPEEAVL